MKSYSLKTIQKGNLAIWLLTAFLLPLISLLLLIQFDYKGIIVIFQVCFLGLLCAIPLFKERVREIYNPAITVSMVYFMMFGLGSLYVLAYPESFRVVGPGAGIELGDLNTGLSFIILCFMLFLLGYYCFDYSKLGRIFTKRIIKLIPNVHKFDLSIRKLPLTLAILILVGWGCRAFLISMGAYFVSSGRGEAITTEYAQIAPLLVLGSLLPLSALCIAFSEYLINTKRKGLLLVSVVLLISELAHAFPTGSKQSAITPIFIVLIIYSVRRKTPVKLLLVSSIVFVLFIFPFVNIYRVNYTGELFPDLVQTFHIYVSSFSPSHEVIVKEKSVMEELLYNVFGIRLNYALIVSVIVEKTPHDSDFKGGYTYIFFFISLVPRLIWSGKPRISSANEFGRDYGFLHPADQNTAVGMSWIGEMFYNFGWYGVFVAFLYGLLYRIIFIYFFRNGRPRTLATIFYAFTLPAILTADAFANWFSGILKFYVVLFAVFIFLARKIDQDK